MGPLCACGCGQYLPEGSAREYKRGHKDNPPHIIDGSVEFTLDDAAAETDNDPPPPGDDSSREVDRPIRITRAVRKDIEGKLAWMLAMGGSMWSIQDPICGGAFLDNTPQIAEKLTPILCQSPGVVKWFRKSSNVALYVDFIIAISPVLQIVYAHHMAKRGPDEFTGDPQAPAHYAA